MRHALIGEDDGVACLTCGAHYCEPVDGELAECSGDTGMAHGYWGERVCWHGSEGETLVSQAHGDTCGHMSHECDCNLCN